MNRAVLPACLALTLACDGGPDRPRIELIVAPAHEELARSFIATIPYDGLTLIVDRDPERATRVRGAELRLALVADLDCEGCYRVDKNPGGFVIHGDAPRGVQYGLAHVLEKAGFRFFHPWETVVPTVPSRGPIDELVGRSFAPEMERRGPQIHTLHPIEGYFAFWEPSADNLEAAKRIGDWVIKNRGNFITWTPLDDIMDDPVLEAAWREHTRAILDFFELRGIEGAVNIQLFGDANLQQAFDLIEDSTNPDPGPEMAERIELLLRDLPFELVTISFGEFFASEPQALIDRSNLAYQLLQAQAPGIEVATVVHVGANDELRVRYQGRDYLYYFIAQFADPAIKLWIHTVMYYNLFEDAGGAYLHEEFVEHRELLLRRLAQGLPTGYYPETGYWVAFDNSVPVYDPLYVRSRWLDLIRIREATNRAGGASLQEHKVLSTGWEWGYWQNDVAFMRMSYQLPDRWEDLIVEMFEVWGAPGRALADEVIGVAALQHRYLLQKRLTPYQAGRDLAIDAGDEIGIVSQPDRPSLAEVRALSAEERAAYRGGVLADLVLYGEGLRQREAAIRGLDLDNLWHREILDGVEVTALRIEYITSLYRAAIAEEGEIDGHLEAARTALERAREVVASRHASLHDPSPERLLETGTNATFYQFGYLHQANELCYWERELIEAEQLLEGSTEAMPTCLL